MTNIQKLLGSAAPIALGLALATPAFAQVSDPAAANPGVPVDQNDTATGGDTITVTGSRIARPDLESPSPVSVVSAQDFDLTGTVTPETLLNNLPQVIPGNTRTSNNQGGENFSTIDLRGLGPQRTLILVDGQRIPPSSSTGVVDIASIPTALISRVEVVTGGASATYGSDAIGGVVNFILKKDFQGLELSSQYGITDHGDGAEFNIAGVLGGNFADNRGNVAISASYYTRAGVSQGDRGFSRPGAVLILGADGKYRISTNPADFSAANGDSFLSRSSTATSPYGTVVNNASNPFRNVLLNQDTDCNPATPGVTVTGGNQSFNANGQLSTRFGDSTATGPICAYPIRANGSSRYNFNPLNDLVTPYKRYNMAMIGSYDVTDAIKFSVLANFTNSTQQVQLAPSPAASPDIIIPYNAAAVLRHPDLVAALASRANPTADFAYRYRFTPVGPRIGDYRSNNYYIRGILEGNLGIGDLKWDTVASFGEVEARNRSQNNINKEAVALGLRGCPAGVSINGAAAAPCTLVDIFGENSLSAAAVNFVRATTKEEREFRQVRVAGDVTGSLFTLPAGPVGFAVGAEYRRDNGNINVDDLQSRGQIYGFNAVQNQRGVIDVSEVYGEVRVPLLGDMPFIHSLSVEGGARYSDYSTVGGLFNWKAGGEYAPVSWLRFRGIYNKAARAPSIVELFQNGDQGFPAYTDPCNAGAARTALALSICQAQTPGVSYATYAQPTAQVQAFAFGSPTLHEEKAETYTLGTVIQPPIPLGKMAITVDYYHIKIKGEIAALGATYYINGCYRGTVAGACANILRDPGTGDIVAVNTSISNQSSTLNTGIDVGVTWAVPLSDVLGGNLGTLAFNENFSYTQKAKIDGTQFAGKNEAGIGGGIAKYKSTLTTTYSQSGFIAQLRWNFASRLVEDILGDPTVDSRTPALSYFDLSLSKDIGDHLTITGIVENVFDQKVKSTPIGYFDQGNVDTVRYSQIILGQTYRVSAKLRF